MYHTNTTLEEDGNYIIVSPTLWGQLERIKVLLTDAFPVDDSGEGAGIFYAEGENQEYGPESAEYILVFTPGCKFIWTGRIIVSQTHMTVPALGTKDGRVRLIADGRQRRLAAAKSAFRGSLLVQERAEDDIGDGYDDDFGGLVLPCITESQAHLPSVNNELKKITRSTFRLADQIVTSVHMVRSAIPPNVPGRQDLLANWYFFASEHGQQAQKFMDRVNLIKFNPRMVDLAISWVSFICDECEPSDSKTFKWAVGALEFTLQRTRKNLMQLSESEFQLLRHKVASCMTLLISHFDILGARSNFEARKEKEKEEEMLKAQFSNKQYVEDDFPLSRQGSDEYNAFPDSTARPFWARVSAAIREVEEERMERGSEYRMLGKVLNDEIPEDRSLSFLASSSSNISIRWQQGKFIGAGAFGSVYIALNLDSGSLMAVKEIKFQELAGIPNLVSHIKDELSVMEMLHHPNVVEYYGIEVHRDKVYIFEEYCQGGSLASLLEHGRIEDERIMQVYAMQMLDGLAYLHSRGIVHRDVKPDSAYLHLPSW